MPDISLTEFVDFVVASGSPKLTKVREIKRRHRLGYEPAADFWKRLREAIVDMHREGTPPKQLDTVIEEQTDQKKLTAYPKAVQGYRKFAGRKKWQWFDPPRATWSHHNLNIVVNPELGLVVNGKRFILKLYFKKEPKLSKRRTEAVFELMRLALEPTVMSESTLGVLDVQQGKLLKPGARAANLDALLNGEALSFESIWNSLP